MGPSFSRHGGLARQPRWLIRGPVAALLSCTDFTFSLFEKNLAKKNKYNGSGYATGGSSGVLEVHLVRGPKANVEEPQAKEFEAFPRQLHIGEPAIYAQDTTRYK